MTQSERLLYLIQYLLKESDETSSFRIPADEPAKKRLLRSLMNIRPPRPAAKDFLDVQDEYNFSESQ